MARGKAKEQADILPRQLEALELRKRGKTYREIANKLNVSIGQAHNDVHGALKQLSTLKLDSADELRQLELERLDKALFSITHFVEAGSPAHVSVYLRIIEQRAKLLGLYAPVKQDITLDVSKLTDDELKRLARGEGGG